MRIRYLNVCCVVCMGNINVWCKIIVNVYYLDLYMSIIYMDM